MNNRILRKIWICTDVWMDTLPFFDHAKLGLKLALLSPRFDVLVDKHFEGKSELTIQGKVEIRKDSESEEPTERCVFTNNANSVHLPLSDFTMPNKIRISFLQISYIDHSVIAFIRSNQQNFDGKGTMFTLSVWSYKSNVQPIWDVLAREIWPIFATNIRRLALPNAAHFDNLCRLISPTILSDLNLSLIESGNLMPDVLDDLDGPNGTSAGQMLSKWLHSPRKDGQPKRLFCFAVKGSATYEWVNSYKEAFLRAITTSFACYTIRFNIRKLQPLIVPFELVNDRTNEKLTLSKESGWEMKRWPIGKTVQWEDENWNNLNTVRFDLCGDKKCIGPLSPPANCAELNYP